MINRTYGWKKQVDDHRDFKMRDLRAVRPMVAVLPSAVNLRKWCSDVQDQGQLGSCTANAWAGLLQYNENKYPVGGRKYFNMSRLFIYYNERVIGNTVNEDSGAQLRDGAKAIATYGSCAEYDWFYDVDKFTVKPTDACYKVALPNHIHSYYSLDGITPTRTLTNLKTCIASGQPFVFGFSVYDSFESQALANTGIMQMPTAQELKDGPIGGHAVMAVGYNDHEQRFLVRNSWGPNWGLKGINAGFFTMRYDFISNPNMASDFWTVVKDI
jgi:C1A family cysteine protease